MRVNIGTQGRLQILYYSFNRRFNGKLREKGVTKGSGKRKRNNSRGTKKFRNRSVWGVLKKERTCLRRDWGIGRHRGSRLNGGPVPPPGASARSAAGQRRNRPGACLRHDTTSSHPHEPPTSLQRERRDAQPGPPRQSRALLPSLPQGRALRASLPGTSNLEHFSPQLEGRLGFSTNGDGGRRHSGMGGASVRDRKRGPLGEGGKRTEEGAGSRGGGKDREKGRALGGGPGRGGELLREGPEEGVAFGEGPEKAGGP